MISNGNVLIVDDDSESLGLLASILAEAGYRVRPADSGKLALTSVEVEPPDLILLDIRMPGMDGFDVCRQLKACNKCREIPVMFISASTDTEERVGGLALGAVDFVSKPFQRDELLARVRTHLELARLRAHLERQVAERTAELLATVEQLQLEIAERARAERSLRESEVRFRNMADTAPVMICASGPDMLATFFNRGWLTFRGRTMEQELGKGWMEGLHPDDLVRCVAELSSSFEARRDCHIEYRLRRADGEYRSVVCSGIPRFEPGGVFTGYIGSCFDITDLKRTQEELLARQKLESLGVLAGGIAHDFNNLLSSILANSELLLADLAGRSPGHEEAEKIRSVAIRAAEIVRELMAFAGQERTEFEPVDVSGLVAEMLRLLQVSISKRATLKVDLPERLPAVRANAAQVRQVVMNLITNASEALGEKDGVISVTLSQVQLPPSSLAGGAPALPQHEYLRLEVSDTGCGMTKEIQARIFDPFFTTKFAGRGMGLAAVQGIIRAHGGAIEVVSSPRQGSRFEVLLPCAGGPVADAPPAVTPAGTGKAERTVGTVLMVEDEETLRLAVSKMLRKKGFSVIEAADGSAAVDLFQANASNIDVVLLDMTLPRMTGREVVDALQRIRPDVKVVLTTAYSENTAWLALGGQQAHAFIRKPYRLAELERLLEGVLAATLRSQAPA
jgi:PAS domain S-box-containing protein